MSVRRIHGRTGLRRARVVLPALALLAAAALAGGCDRSSSPTRAGVCDPTADACARRIDTDADAIGGGRATGQPGDTVLENARSRFVIQRPLRAIAPASQFGGNVIDADVRRAAGEPGRDAFGELAVLANLAGTMATESVEVVSAGGAGATAEVVARGGYALNGYLILAKGIETLIGFDLFALTGADLDQPWPLGFAIHYRLEPNASALRIDVTVTNLGAAQAPLALFWLAQSGLTQLFVPTGAAFDPGAVALADAMYFESNDPTVDVAYGVVPEQPDPSRPMASLLGVNGLTARGTPSQLLLFPKRAPDHVPPGGSVTLGGWLVVGHSMDAVLAEARRLRGARDCVAVAGRVVEEGTGLAIPGAKVTALAGTDAASGAALSNARTSADGNFSLCLPPGPVTLIAGQPGRPYAGGGRRPEPLALTIPERGAAALTPTIVLPRTARLRVTTLDVAGMPLPARLTVLGVDPSPPDPRLDGDGFDPLAPGVLRMEDARDGAFDVLVEPGDVDVVVSRGVEYALFREPVHLDAGDVKERTVTLPRVVDTRGYLSGDFHVHSNPGPDSTVSYAKRVVNMLAEGVDVIVSTDHDFWSDYGPTIRALGAEGEVASIVGQEITTFATGHFGAFPFQRTGEPNGGAVDWIGRDPVQIADAVFARSPNAILQIMHPRAMPAPGNVSNYFVSIDLRFDGSGPMRGPLAVPPSEVRLPDDAQWLTPRWNAMEVVTFSNVQGLADWSNLLNAGWRLTATGNSDTHTRWVEASGYARNLVRVGEGFDDLARFDAGRFVAGVRAGASSVVLGPFVDLEVRSADGRKLARTGETLDASRTDTVTAVITVQSPAWLECDQVTLLAGGRALTSVRAKPTLVAVAGSESPLAFRNETRVEIPVTIDQDTWLAALVTGDQSLYPLLPYNWQPADSISLEAIRANDLPGTVRPFSLTNAVWVDANGDGQILPSHEVVPQDCQAFPRVDRTKPYVSVPARNCACVPEAGPSSCF
ncbi:MAG: CehA/McbA family metallohydrolase [bacterium]